MVWWHLCTGTVLNGCLFSVKTMVPWDTRAEDTRRLLGAPPEPTSLSCRAAMTHKMGACSFTLRSAPRGPSLVSGAISDVPGKPLRGRVYFLSPRSSLEPSLQD